MIWLPVHIESIPHELRALDHWVLWRAEPAPGKKPDKVPYHVSAPMRRASSTDPRTWSTFFDAYDAYSALVDRAADPDRGPVAGIGVALTREADITCLDLDGVYRDDVLDPRAATVIARCGYSWTERSPSGSGLHVFVRGTVPTALIGPELQVYACDRFIAVTGHQWPGTTAHLSNQQAYLDILTAIAHTGETPRRPWTGKVVPPPDDLAGALLAKLERWGLPAHRMKPWQDGYLVELETCPWASEHTSGPGGSAVMIRSSGAFDFTCLHAHCTGRTWRDFRALMDARR